MQWFISQAIYDPEPMIKLLKEYGALCKEAKIAPKRVVLTFAPCGREKTMRFIKWLGVTVPEDVEKEILEAENKVGKSVDLLCGMCKRILEETKGCGVPLGVSVESVSIFKNEIDAAHELFRRTQSMLLDFLGEPWLVRYSIVDRSPSARRSITAQRPADGGAAVHEEKAGVARGDAGKREGDPGRRGSGARARAGQGPANLTRRTLSPRCARVGESDESRRTSELISLIRRRARERLSRTGPKRRADHYFFHNMDDRKATSRAPSRRPLTRGRPPPLTAGETSPRRVPPRPWRSSQKHALLVANAAFTGTFAPNPVSTASVRTGSLCRRETRRARRRRRSRRRTNRSHDDERGVRIPGRHPARVSPPQPASSQRVRVVSHPPRRANERERLRVPLVSFMPRKRLAIVRVAAAAFQTERADLANLRALVHHRRPGRARHHENQQPERLTVPAEHPHRARGVVRVEQVHQHRGVRRARAQRVSPAARVAADARDVRGLVRAAHLAVRPPEPVRVHGRDSGSPRRWRRPA